VAYPSGLCAERVALFTAGATYPDDPVTAIAVTAHTDEFVLSQPVTSCGGCLQVMAEFEKKSGQPISVLFYCRNGVIWKTEGIKNLVPFLFEESRLVK
jgi:cytidine deaminase